MRKNNFFGEILVAGILLLLLFLNLNLLQTFMPSMKSEVIILIIIMLSAIFIGLVWKEKPRDEREQLHSLKAGKIAYLAGIAVLTMGIILQIKQYDIDPWLIWALVTMVGVKLISKTYNEIKY